MKKKQKREKYEEIDCSILISCDKGDDDMQLAYYFET
jgi:hypothetical protein